MSLGLTLTTDPQKSQPQVVDFNICFFLPLIQALKPNVLVMGAHTGGTIANRTHFVAMRVKQMVHMDPLVRGSKLI